jgi:hypothetical protein
MPEENGGMSPLWDMNDPEFWAEYEQFMREPVDEGESLQAMKEFVEGEENA